MKRRWTTWMAGTGLVLASLGLGFTVDAEPRFVQSGLLLCAIGAMCYLLAGWVDFGRKKRS